MGVTHCLGMAAMALRGVPRGQWKAYIDALPVSCPHDDCTGAIGCRAQVGAYFRMQWYIAMHAEKKRRQATGASS